MRELLAIVVCALSFGVAECQQTSVAPEQDKGNAATPAPQEAFPKLRLEFSEAKPVSGAVSSPLIANQKQCGPDGAIYVQMAIPPLYRERQVVALGGDGGSQTYSLSLVPNALHDISLVDYSPTSSEVGFLVRATETAEQTDYRTTNPNGKTDTGKGYRGEHHNYIITFDRKGNYKTTIDLGPDEIYTKLGELESGDFVLLGYDSASRTADLELIDQSGKRVRTLPIPAKLEDDPLLAQGETGGAVEVAKAVGGLSHWQFTTTRGKVVLSRPGSLGVVLEIGPGGAFREVPLEMPPAYELDGFVPAMDRWIVRYRLKSLPEKGGIDTRSGSGNFQLFDVNPLDGSLRTELDLPGSSSIFGVGCEADGEVLMVGLNDKQQFQISKADLAK